MSAGFMFLAFKKRITDSISHAAGFSIFLNISTKRTMRKHGSIVCISRPCLQKGPTQSARMRTIVTAALQGKYL
jgi:hypothetical protein